MGVFLVPVVIKKELAELEWLSILLAVAVLIFGILTLVLLIKDDYTPTIPNPYENRSIWWPILDWGALSSLSTLMVAYSYQQNVFPVYESLKEKTAEVYKKSSLIGLSFSMFIYLSVALIAILLF